MPHADSASIKNNFHCNVCIDIAEAELKRRNADTKIAALTKAISGRVFKCINPQDSSSRNFFGKRKAYRPRALSIAAAKGTLPTSTIEGTYTMLEGHGEATNDGESLEIVVRDILNRLRIAEGRALQRTMREEQRTHSFEKEITDDSEDETNEHEADALTFAQLTWEDIPKVWRASRTVITYVFTMFTASLLCILFEGLEACRNYLSSVSYFVKRCTYPNTRG
jgi:hypothetical protein